LLGKCRHPTVFKTYFIKGIFKAQAFSKKGTAARAAVPFLIVFFPSRPDQAVSLCLLFVRNGRKQMVDKE